MPNNEIIEEPTLVLVDTDKIRDVVDDTLDAIDRANEIIDNADKIIDNAKDIIENPTLILNPNIIIPKPKPTLVQTIDRNTLDYNVDIFNNFNNSRLQESVDPYVKGIPYLFITTPLLNLSYSNIKKDTYFAYMGNMRSDILNLMSYGASGSDNFANTSVFIKPLSNKFKSIDLKDTTARTKQVSETWYGQI